MTIEEIFIRIKNAPDDKKWEAADDALAKYNGKDKDLIRSQVGEFIAASVVLYAD
jgi:hypothetical protein